MDFWKRFLEFPTTTTTTTTTTTNNILINQLTILYPYQLWPCWCGRQKGDTISIRTRAGQLIIFPKLYQKLKPHWFATVFVLFCFFEQNKLIGFLDQLFYNKFKIETTALNSNSNRLKFMSKDLNQFWMIICYIKYLCPRNSDPSTPSFPTCSEINIWI